MSARQLFSICASLCLAFLVSTATAQTTWYVDDDGNPGNGCTSWLDACPDLQTALGLAVSGDQVWVATGTYKPTPGWDRTATFQLITGVELYGGFDGTESTLGERAGLFDQTILSGDLGDSDCCYAHAEAGCDNPACEAAVCSSHPECCDSSWDEACASYAAFLCEDICRWPLNSYHVVTGSGTDQRAVLDGFTVTGGHTHPDPEEPPPPEEHGGGGMRNDAGSPTVANCTFTGNEGYNGGGMFNANSSPTLINCTFSGNDSWERGGGMFNYGSSPTVTNCTFSGNTATGGGGAMTNYDSSPTVTNCTFSGNSVSVYGGGMLNDNYSSPTVTNCTFNGNTAVLHAGGMCNRSNSSPTVTNCTFSGNTAYDYGGAMYNGDSSPTVTNCTFSGNSGGYDGGGMYNDGSAPTLANCTFSGNGSAISCDSYLEQSPSDVQIANCIFWDGGDEIRNNDGSTIAITYSDVQDDDPNDGNVYPGTGNIDDDPMFVDADGLDDVPGTQDDNLRLTGGSPCIDAGDNTAVTVPMDLDGNTRIVDGDGDSTVVVDMGPYEFGSAPEDCNENEIPDICDLNCNALGGACDVPDCGRSSDNDGSGVPDECECYLASPTELDPSPDPCDIGFGTRNRYMSFVAGDQGWLQAVRVTFTSMPGYEYAEGRVMWVQEPYLVTEASGSSDPTPPPTFWAAELGCAPFYANWTLYDCVDVYDDAVVPGATFEVRVITQHCDTANPENYSTALTVVMSATGDAVGDCAVTPCTAPQGVVDFVDISACVEKFKNTPGAPRKARADVINSDIAKPKPDQKVDFVDISYCVDAFRGQASPLPGPLVTDPCQ